MASKLQPPVKAAEKPAPEPVPEPEPADEAVMEEIAAEERPMYSYPTVAVHAAGSQEHACPRCGNTSLARYGANGAHCHCGWKGTVV